MTSKEAILELIRSLPNAVTVQEVIAQLRNNFQELEALENREKAARLVESWLEEKSGYDARVWPGTLERIERNRLASRPRLGSPS